MTTKTEQVEQAITKLKAILKTKASDRDALNAALEQRDLATALLKTEQERSAMLLDELETIRAVTWMYGAPTLPRLKTIDQTAREVLRASGQIPTCTTEED